MEILLLRAKLVLANMFNINISNFEIHTTRRIEVVEARRFLVYFLRDELGLTYQKIAKLIPAISNHATAIHHYKKLTELMDVERKTAEKYNAFRKSIVEDSMIEKELIAMLDQRNKLNNQIYKLKKLL